ncbi:MAG: SDR family NAD(P)-dependent oxidoreductase [Planktotalea sp.]|jgi:NAD(P)-dependent dehydrogenase (short-subunit alcohol dehydrogenase family)|uniref:SDR family NAD(P)-dependent oxidoreductase n=1 Tax=Planktotalea sp. TaxID=2029877 RepID=UPI001DF781E2|nr:SDR family NAD(P)-dependent oxidoreductase [Planktotalea sp.]MBT5823187.1 SDR family oxidoreductase [Paracoccaceae bacterium]MDG1075604.1 SDR family NAD(P)-dependent oxidoreductase [Planktotalea sp.]MDG1084829.1 SDR family NAD(P)-dependent oxidoreductase [Planktotalea sp.]
MSKIALVTGASRGLGFALAEALAKTHHVVAVARTTGALEDLDDKIQASGGQATLAPMDITNEGAMAQLCRSIYDRWGSIDLWAHTAVHAAPLTPAAHIDAKDWAKSIAINATSMGLLIPYVSPLLGEASTAVFFDDQTIGEKFHGSYAASKAAQMYLAKAWARETETTGPRVLIETPPAMSTATRSRFHPGEDRSALAHPRDVAAELLERVINA